MALVVQCKARMGSQFVCEREGGGSRCHCYTTLDHVVDMAATSALTVTQVIAGVVDYRITSLACWRTVPTTEWAGASRVLTLCVCVRACVDDKVVAGCHDGSLRVFARGTGAGRAEFHPIFTKAAFAPRPIDSVVIIDPVDVIVSISDAVCSVHDLASFAQVDTLDTGGAAPSPCAYMARRPNTPSRRFTLRLAGRQRVLPAAGRRRAAAAPVPDRGPVAIQVARLPVEGTAPALPDRQGVQPAGGPRHRRRVHS